MVKWNIGYEDCINESDGKFYRSNWNVLFIIIKFSFKREILN